MAQWRPAFRGLRSWLVQPCGIVGDPCHPTLLRQIECALPGVAVKTAPFDEAGLFQRVDLVLQGRRLNPDFGGKFGLVNWLS